MQEVKCKKCGARFKTVFYVPAKDVTTGEFVELHHGKCTECGVEDIVKVKREGKYVV